MPQYTVIFEAENDFLKQRVKELPPEKTEGTHYVDAQQERRIKLWREQNPSTEADTHIYNFFKTLVGDKNVMLLQAPDTIAEKESETLKDIQNK